MGSQLDDKEYCHFLLKVILLTLFTSVVDPFPHGSSSLLVGRLDPDTGLHWECLDPDPGGHQRHTK
jgi:hypothetical protein